MASEQDKQAARAKPQLQAKIHKGKTYILGADGFYHELMLPDMKVKTESAPEEVQRALGGKLPEPPPAPADPGPDPLASIPSLSSRPAPPPPVRRPQGRQPRPAKPAKYQGKTSIAEKIAKNNMGIFSSIGATVSESILHKMFDIKQSLKPENIAAGLFGRDVGTIVGKARGASQSDLLHVAGIKTRHYGDDAAEKLTRQDVREEREVQRVPGEPVGGENATLVAIMKNTHKTNDLLTDLVRYFKAKAASEGLAASFDEENKIEEEARRKGIARINPKTGQTVPEHSGGLTAGGVAAGVVEGELATSAIKAIIPKVAGVLAGSMPLLLTAGVVAAIIAILVKYKDPINKALDKANDAVDNTLGFKPGARERSLIKERERELTSREHAKDPTASRETIMKRVQEKMKSDTVTKSINKSLESRNARAAAKNPVVGIIHDEARKAGLDPAAMETVATIESNLNPGLTAPNGKYKGLFQLSEAESGLHGKDIFDPQKNAEAAMKSFKKTHGYLTKKLGREPTPEEMYFAHQQGAGGLLAQAKNPDRPAWMNMAETAEGRQKGIAWAKKAISGNLTPAMRKQFGDDISGGDFLDSWFKRYDKISSKIIAPVQNNIGDALNKSSNAVKEIMTNPGATTIIAPTTNNNIGGGGGGGTPSSAPVRTEESSWRTASGLATAASVL